MQHTVTWVQKKDSRKGAYLRIGLQDGGFFNCYDRPLPDLQKGDVIEVSEKDDAGSVLRGVKKVGAGSPAFTPGDPVMFYVSYAKDILLAELSPASDASEAAFIAEELMDAFGSERQGSMLAAYAKDLICAGWKVEDAISAIQDMRASLQAAYQLGESE